MPPKRSNSSLDTPHTTTGADPTVKRKGKKRKRTPASSAGASTANSAKRQKQQAAPSANTASASASVPAHHVDWKSQLGYPSTLTGQLQWLHQFAVVRYVLALPQTPTKYTRLTLEHRIALVTPAAHDPRRHHTASTRGVTQSLNNASSRDPSWGCLIINDLFNTPPTKSLPLKPIPRKTILPLIFKDLSTACHQVFFYQQRVFDARTKFYKHYKKVDNPHSHCHGLSDGHILLPTFLSMITTQSTRCVELINRIELVYQIACAHEARGSQTLCDRMVERETILQFYSASKKYFEQSQVTLNHCLTSFHAISTMYLQATSPTTTTTTPTNTADLSATGTLCCESRAAPHRI